MSAKDKKKDKHRVDKKKSAKSDKSDTAKGNKIQQAATTAFSLLANDQSLDLSLSSLFAVKQPAVKSKQTLTPQDKVPHEEDEVKDDEDVEPSEDDSDDPDEDGEGPDDEAVPRSTEIEIRRKRKRKEAEDEIEDVYMHRLAREEAKETERVAAERLAKRSKSDAERIDEDIEDVEDEPIADSELGDVLGESDGDEDDDDDGQLSPPPRHETETAADEEFSKATRTVFLGNVSTEAISSKAHRKTLLHHLGSFFPELAVPKKGEAKYKVESIRFRSTPYASAIPKKAAFAKKEVMDATTKSTNAYAVYSTAMLAREAVKRLNGSVVLDRHLRVDQVAHPAKVDNRRCVFVGNLGFVDDESNIIKANEEEGREKRKQGKEPADIEEGLWRTFGKCGVVESVRVIRDSTTRVGKGIAYVQFEDENAVEAALLYNEKKFPPMLPRKLRVTRARAQKRNAKPGSGRPTTSRPSANGYQRKITAEEASKAGRAGKMLGRAAAARVRNPAQKQGNDGPAEAKKAIQKPESFVFEGHRASARQGKTGLKLGGRNNKNKVTKRSASFRANKRKA